MWIMDKCPSNIYVSYRLELTLLSLGRVYKTRVGYLVMLKYCSVVYRHILRRIIKESAMTRRETEETIMLLTCFMIWVIGVSRRAQGKVWCLIDTGSIVTNVSPVEVAPNITSNTYKVSNILLFISVAFLACAFEPMIYLYSDRISVCPDLGRPVIPLTKCCQIFFGVCNSTPLM